MGKQELSIGSNCDRLGTVEHEFLHALGFWHEQSRSDRDDYVTIVWDQIEEGNNWIDKHMYQFMPSNNKSLFSDIILSCQTWFVPHIGKEHNFNLYDETVSSSLGVPYDYGSVMHYSKTSFNKDQEPTIVTKIPEFLDVIGQRMEFSDSDLLKLNRLYNCSKFMITLYNAIYVGDLDWLNNPPLIFNNFIEISLNDKIKTACSVNAQNLASLTHL